MALEAPLLNKLLGLGAEISIMAVGQPALLRLVDGMPLRADIDAAGKADLASRLRRCGAQIRSVAVDERCSRRPAVRLRRRRRCGHLGGEGDLVRLPRAAGQGQVGLLEVLDVELERVQTAVIDGVLHLVDDGLRRDVLLTPNGGGHSAAIAVNGDDVELVATRALDRGDVESKQVPSLVSTLNMH